MNIKTHTNFFQRFKADHYYQDIHSLNIQKEFFDYGTRNAVLGFWDNKIMNDIRNLHIDFTKHLEIILNFPYKP